MAISLRDRSSEVLERLMGGPIGQKIAADIASEALAKRKSAVVEVGRLQSVLDREIPRFAGMMAGAALDVMKAESALAEAKSRQLGAAFRPRDRGKGNRVGAERPASVFVRASARQHPKVQERDSRAFGKYAVLRTYRQRRPSQCFHLEG